MLITIVVKESTQLTVTQRIKVTYTLPNYDPTQHDFKMAKLVGFKKEHMFVSFLLKKTRSNWTEGSSVQY